MNKPQKAGGHAAHTQDADDPGMPGTLRKPIKITMLGAGSGFTPRLANDVMRIPGNSGGTIALVDIDRERLTTMHKLLVKLAKQLGKARQWKIISSTNRREVMGASDYLVNCIEVSGTGCVHFDNDIPLKYGVDQCIGDTIGPGDCSRRCARSRSGWPSSKTPSGSARTPSC